MGGHVAPTRASYWGLIDPQTRHFGVVCTVVGKSWFVYRHDCASIQTMLPFHFFLRDGPSNQEQGSRCYLQVLQIGRWGEGDSRTAASGLGHPPQKKTWLMQSGFAGFPTLRPPDDLPACRPPTATAWRRAVRDGLFKEKQNQILAADTRLAWATNVRRSKRGLVEYLGGVLDVQSKTATMRCFQDLAAQAMGGGSAAKVCLPTHRPASDSPSLTHKWGSGVPEAAGPAARIWGSSAHLEGHRVRGLLVFDGPTIFVFCDECCWSTG